MSKQDSKFTKKHVQRVYCMCLFLPDMDDPEESIQIEGLLTRSNFHRGRLQEHVYQIDLMLEELASKVASMSPQPFNQDQENEPWVDMSCVDRVLQMGAVLGKTTLLPKINYHLIN